MQELDRLLSSPNPADFDHSGIDELLLREWTAVMVGVELRLPSPSPDFGRGRLACLSRNAGRFLDALMLTPAERMVRRTDIGSLRRPVLHSLTLPLALTLLAEFRASAAKGNRLGDVAEDSAAWNLLLLNAVTARAPGLALAEYLLTLGISPLCTSLMTLSYRTLLVMRACTDIASESSSIVKQRMAEALHSMQVDVGRVFAAERREFASLMLAHPKVTRPRLKNLLKSAGILNLEEVPVGYRPELIRSTCQTFRDQLHAESRAYEEASRMFGIESPYITEWKPRDWEFLDERAREMPQLAHELRMMVEAQASFQLESAGLFIEIALIEGDVDQTILSLRESHRLVEVEFVNDVYVLTLRRGLLPAAKLETLKLKRVVKGG